MRYVVAHVINSPAGGVRTARLVISDVPDRTTVDEVMRALEAAGLTSPSAARRNDPRTRRREPWREGGFSEAGVPFGNHEIKAEGRRGWPAGIAGIDAAPVVAWSRLTAERVQSEGRRITLRLEPAEYDRVALAATRAGESIQAWAMRALMIAADAAPEAVRPASSADARAAAGAR